jgi:hypothetical protein
MTPRALVTAIATTAFGFALIIGSVAWSTSSATGQASEALGHMTRRAVHMQPYGLAPDKPAPFQCAAWNDPCEVSL